jgi:hypothetical protein
MILWLGRISLLIVLALTIGLILTLRLGGVGPNDFTYPKYSASEFKHIEGLMPTIETWQWQRSETLLDQSRAIYSGNINQTVTSDQLQQAKHLALQAYQQDITFGYGAAQLLAVYEKTNDFSNADQLARLASYLWPAHPQTRAQLADYWLRRGNAEELVKEWNVLLTRDAGLHKEFYPLLLKLAKNETTQSALAQLIETPPIWWNSFFSYIAQIPEESELLDILFESRRTSKTPLSNEETQIYVARLIKDNYWQEAHTAWLESLSNRQLQLGGTIYDGGFEDNNFNTSGFSWQLKKHRMITIEPAITTGMKGSKALKINIRKGERIDFQHLSQYLVLEPNHYTLKLAYKVDQFKSVENSGLSWKIYCNNSQNTLLGESTAINAKTSWSTLAINFTVPDTECKAQLLRLESSTPYAHQHHYDAIIWFDDIAITPNPSDTESIPNGN